MRRLWIPLVLLGWLFLVAGCVSCARGVIGYARDSLGAGTGQRATDLWITVASGLVAAAGGFFLLRGRSSARWVCAGWMAAHVGISLLHGLGEVLTHAALLAVLVLVLWHPRARASLAARGT